MARVKTRIHRHHDHGDGASMDVTIEIPGFHPIKARRIANQIARLRGEQVEQLFEALAKQGAKVTHTREEAPDEQRSVLELR